MKKILVAVLAAATLTFIIAGCGPKEEEAAPAPTTTAPATPPATTG